MGHITGLLLLLWVGATVSTVLDLQKRIVGVQRCNDNERKYHVKLLDGHNKFVCGGSLIDPLWVLTATHCYPALEAVVGVHPGKGTPQDITKAVPFKDTDTNGNNRTHDIMLLKLTDPVNDITPVPLPDCGNRPKVTEEVQIAGHTAPNPAKKNVCEKSTDLKCAETDVVDCKKLKKCLVKDDKAFKLLEYQHKFCAHRAGVDVCEGDSGGGVVYDNKIHGVISSHVNGTCAGLIVFMDVCRYLTWIQNTIARPRS